MSFSPTQEIATDGISKTISKNDIKEIKKQAKKSEVKRSRICLHKDHNDLVQEMIIALCKESYVPPHKQDDMEKSYYLYEGELEIIFFKNKEVIKKILLNKENPICRFNASIWHTAMSKTEICVYSEIIAGPYQESRTHFAPWAPERNKANEGIRYLKEIIND